MSKTATKALQQQVMAEAMALQSLKPVTMEELAKHGTEADAWVLIDGVVYDVTKFAKLHPGGRGVLQRAAGKDATKDFKMVHHDSVLGRYPNLRVGRIALEAMEPAAVKELMKAKATEKWLPLTQPYFNDIRGTLKSPHFQEKHLKYQAKLVAFLKREVEPHAAKWDEARKYPRELHKKAYEAGVYTAGAPPEYGGTPPEGGWDYFMVFIQSYELTRYGTGGLITGLYCLSIGLPPILHHGSEEMKQTVGRAIITGDKLCALAITEPWGGSDVAQLRTFAEVDGEDYVISGEKKFISGG